MKCFTNTSEIGRFFGLAEYPSISFKKVCVDSRYVEPGDIFFALPGEKVDGHIFLEEVKQRGAVAAVVRRDYKTSCELPMLPVDNTLEALQLLASSALKKRSTKVIAITGSVGKTTTKEMIGTLLEQRFNTVRSPRNYNSQIGLPLTILNHTTGDEDYLVQEMGMTGAGQITGLIKIAPPTIAVLTHIALVHAAFFSSLQEIARAKAEIFLHPATKIGFFPETIACRDVIEYQGCCVKAPVSMTHNRYPLLPFPGDHLRQNFILAAAVARECGLSEEEIIQRIPFLQLPEKRQERIEREGITFINDSYNASVPSVVAAFKALPAPKMNGKRIAVIGEMLELGRFSEDCHREVAESALDHVDLMLCLGEGCQPIVDCWKSKGRPVHYFDDRAALVVQLKKMAASGDVVLLKGSNGKQLWKVLDEV